jgi:hypothetical protein
MAQFHRFIRSKLDASVDMLETDSTCLLNVEDESWEFFSKLITIELHEKSKTPVPTTTRNTILTNEILNLRTKAKAIAPIKLTHAALV